MQGTVLQQVRTLAGDAATPRGSAKEGGHGPEAGRDCTQVPCRPGPRLHRGHWQHREPLKAFLGLLEIPVPRVGVGDRQPRF